MSATSKRSVLCTVEKAAAFVKRVSGAKAEEFPAVGEGRDVRFTGRNLTGAALTVDEHIIHLSAFHVTHKQTLWRARHIEAEGCGSALQGMRVKLRAKLAFAF